MVGIIAAMNIEAENLISAMKKPHREKIGALEFVTGNINSEDCVVAVCGVGKVNAAVCTQTMILTYRPSRIINTGVAGGTDPRVNIGDIVLASRLVQHDMDTTAVGDEPGLLSLPGGSRVYIETDRALLSRLEDICADMNQTYITGTVATGDQFISGMEKRLSIGGKFGALACEMEGGAVAQTCYLSGVPFAVLRCISDGISDGSDLMEYTEFAPMAAGKSAAILREFFNHKP